MVGQYLAEVFPDANLYIFEGGGHDLGFTHATQIAPLIDQYLEK